EAQRRWRLSERLGLAAGLYAGGGGGAAAPVGGGLMLRPHADFVLDMGGWQLGLSASHVRFPSGDIHSTQLGVVMMVEDRFSYTAPGHGGETVDFGGRGGLGADAMHLTLGAYTRRTDSPQTLGYVGMRLEQGLDSVWSANLEAAGAAHGGSEGYAEMLGGVSALWPVAGDTLRLGARAALGLGGGGAVRTGGGLIGKAALAGRLQLGRKFSIDLEGGEVKGLRGGGFSARYAQVSLGMALGESGGFGGWGPRQRVTDMGWELSVQHYLDAARKDGSSHSLQAVGLKFRRSFTPNFYLTGQAHTAFAGGAGAYSVGLVGIGAMARPFGKATPWSIGAEALVGAAGGGGVATKGGAIAQPMAWVGRDLGTYSRVRVAGGYVKSKGGQLATPVVEVSWGMDFGSP
ncbi:MAG TPA: hypothetical protein VFP68_16070, partial [Burkholderiaceae bacterium]|nr:hypothetical protein [Burkholderiaceae bacterium]